MGCTSKAEVPRWHTPEGSQPVLTAKTDQGASLPLDFGHPGDVLTVVSLLWANQVGTWKLPSLFH